MIAYDLHLRSRQIISESSSPAESPLEININPLQQTQLLSTHINYTVHSDFLYKRYETFLPHLVHPLKSVNKGKNNTIFSKKLVQQKCFHDEVILSLNIIEVISGYLVFPSWE